MIAYIILCAFVAFIAGVGVGMRYMHNKYNQQMVEHNDQLEKLKLQAAEINGWLKAMNIPMRTKEGQDVHSDSGETA